MCAEGTAQRLLHQAISMTDSSLLMRPCAQHGKSGIHTLQNEAKTRALPIRYTSRWMQLKCLPHGSSYRCWIYLPYLESVINITCYI